MILIVESGATKTQWALVSSKIEWQNHSNGISPFYQTEAEIFEEISTVTNPIKQHSIRQIAYFGTGIVSAETATIIKNGFEKVFVEASVSVQSDVIGAAIATCHHGAGLVAILGTGSNSCFFANGKITQQIPPLGFWLGDEGSGGHIGKLLVQSYLHKSLPEDLRQSFESKYGVLGRLEILNHAYHKTFPNRYFAKYTHFCGEHIQHTFIKDLVEGSFDKFMELYICKYQIESKKLNVVGSIAEIFKDQLLVVAQKHGFEIEKILKNPMDGLVDFYL